MKLKRPAVLVALACLSLTACTSPPVSKTAERDLQKSRADYDDIVKNLRRQSESSSGFFIDDSPVIAIERMDKKEQDARARAWLTNTRVTFDPAGRSAVNAAELIRMLRQQFGINIVANVPLNAYSYNGFGVTNVDAETAINIFLGAMGLDYDLDNDRKVVTVQPMKPRTWTLNLGNRKTAFSAGAGVTGSASGVAGNPANLSTMGAGTSGTAAGSVTGSGGAINPGATGTVGTGEQSTTGISSDSDFWKSLNDEIKERLTILIPGDGMDVPRVAGAGMPMSSPVPQGDLQAAPGQSDGKLYKEQLVGRYSVNAETGAITVQAPKYILKGIDEYLTKVQDMYNTTITLEGQIVSVTSTNSSNEGLDWSAFNRVANGRYTSVLQNNILGGATVSTPGANDVVGSVTFGNATMPGIGATVGIMSASKQFALFNAFLSSVGQVKVLETPLVTTTSGVPVKFEKKQLRYYTRYSQEAAAGGTGGSTVATNSDDVPYTIGMSLRINPRYDIDQGVVRAQFSLDRSTLSGFENKVNVLTSASGAFQNIQSRLPIVSTTANNGEILLKDGDMIVVGGMTEDQEENTDSGVTGMIDNGLGRSLLGQGARQRTASTYYFAIRVTVKRKS